MVGVEVGLWLVVSGMPYLHGAVVEDAMRAYR
jgi:hypothetical protein